MNTADRIGMSGLHQAAGYGQGNRTEDQFMANKPEPVPSTASAELVAQLNDLQATSYMLADRLEAHLNTIISAGFDPQSDQVEAPLPEPNLDRACFLAARTAQHLNRLRSLIEKLERI